MASKKRVRKQRFEGKVVDANRQSITGSGFGIDEPLKQGQMVTLVVRAVVSNVSHGHADKLGFVRSHTLKVVTVGDLDVELQKRVDQAIDDLIAEREAAAYAAEQNIPEGQLQIGAGDEADVIDAEVVG